MAITLAYDKSQAPLLKITVTESDPTQSRAFQGGTWAIQLLGGQPIPINYDGGVLPFYGYTDSAGRVWTKVTDTGLVAVFTATA